MVTTSNLSQRSTAFVVKKLLTRALPYLVFEKFGQSYPLPTNSTKVAKFRRYRALPLATTPLVEGVTPTGKSLLVDDYTATLQQYGDFVQITDQIADTHEDPVLNEATTVIAEQAAQTLEAVRFGILKAGTNVQYANSAANRLALASAITLNDLRIVTRGFKRQNAGMINQKVSSSANFNTEAVEPGYIAVCHPDVENDIRGLAGFINAKDYGSMTPYETEIGAVENIRFLMSTVVDPWEDATCPAANVAFVSGTTYVKVYPILVFAKNAYGLVPLKGKDSITPMVMNPGKASVGDELGQRGFVSWKAMTTAVILADEWMARIEVLATEL
jgi:N4-gp56 family major capsid protein